MSHHLDIYKGRSTDRSTHSGRPVATPISALAPYSQTLNQLRYGRSPEELAEWEAGIKQSSMGPKLPGAMIGEYLAVAQQYQGARTAPWNQHGPPNRSIADKRTVELPWFLQAISRQSAGGFAGPQAASQQDLQSITGRAGAGYDWTMKHITEPAAAETTALLAKYEGLKKYDHRETMATYEDLPSWAKPNFVPPTPDLGSYAGREELKLFQDRAKKYQAQGYSRSEANTKAYRESEFAGEGYKGIVEMVVDPIGLGFELIPGGLAARPALAAARATAKGAATGAMIGARGAGASARALANAPSHSFFDPLFSQPQQLFREINRASPGAINDPLSWSQATPNVQVANMTDVGNGIWIADEGVEYAGREVRQVRMPDGRLQPFYKRTGSGDQGRLPDVDNAEGAFAGNWVPFDGIMEVDMGLMPREGGMPWFNKHRFASGAEGGNINSPLFRYGDEEHKAVGTYLDSVDIPSSARPVGEDFNQVNNYLDNYHRGSGIETGIMSDLNERTIGQVFPDGAPFREIESAMGDAFGRTRTQPVYGDKVLVRNPNVSDVFPFNKPGISVDHRSGIELARGGTKADQVIRSWSVPEIVLNMKRALDRRGAGEGAFSLSDDELSDVKDFLEGWGVDPWNTSDPTIGRFHVDAATGDRQFVVGAFDNPMEKTLVGDDALNQRYYITYSPGTKKYSLSRGIGERPSMIDVETGANNTQEIQNIVNSANDEIAKINAQIANEPIGSPEHRHFLALKNAEEQKKLSRIQRVEARPTRPTPEPVEVASIEEILEYEKVWNNLYTETVDGQILPKGVAKSSTTHRDPYNPWKVMSVADSEYEQFRAHMQYDIDGQGRKMMNTMFIAESADSRNATVFDAWASTVKKTARQNGLPDPPTPIGTGVADEGDPVGALDEVINPRPGTPLDQNDVYAKYAGARSVAAAEVQTWYEQGNRILKKLAKAHNLQFYQNRYVFPKELGVRLLAALHDEAPIPEGFDELVEHIRIMRDKEQSEYVQFDPTIKDVFASHPEYFPRLWKRRVEPTDEFEPVTTFLDDERKYRHLEARVDDTFLGLINKEYQPVSLNPLDLMAMRRITGVEHREMLQIVKRLKDSGVAIPVYSSAKLDNAATKRLKEPAIPKGYRVPDGVGPAFEGVRVTNKQGERVTLHKYAVPDDVAGRLELIFGKQPKLMTAGLGKFNFDIAKAARAFATVPKRAILTFSAFQHLDMLFRPLGASFSPTGLKTLAPLRGIPLSGRILAVSLLGDLPKGWGGLGRTGSRNRALDPTPMYDDFDISHRMIAENGWQINGDTSFIRREALEFTDVMASQTKVNTPKIVLDRLRQLRNWWESNLFDGVYRESQMFMLDNFIVPKLRQMFPTETAEQIARRAADEVNILSSSLGNWQTIFRSPALKDFATIGMFSSNESETWIRASVNAVKPKSEIGSLYREYWLGYGIFLAALGNSINMITTGRPLPSSAYSPLGVTKDEEGFIPWKLRYNPHFMSPVIGHGREGQEIHLDIVGQADTPWMWLVSPKEALSARLSPLINMVRPFITHKTFFGEDLERGDQQAIYAAMQSLPIGATQALQYVKGENEFLDSFLPSAEEGIGGIGRGLQISGFNVRKKSSQELREELARREGFEPRSIPREWNDPSTWDGQLSAYEVMREQLAPGDYRVAITRPENQAIVNELQHRLESGVDRGQEWAEATDTIRQADSERIDQETNLVAAVQRGEVDFQHMVNGFWPQYQRIQQEHRIKLHTYDKVYDIFRNDEEPPKASLPLARYQYYEIFETAKTDYGSIDWEIFEHELKKHKDEVWNPEQIEHIETKLEQKNHAVYHQDTPWLVDVLETKDKYSWYFELKIGHLESVGMKDEYKAYSKTNNKQGFLNAHPELKKHLKAVEEAKKEIREAPQNSELLNLLYILGNIDGSTLIRVTNENAQYAQ